MSVMILLQTLSTDTFAVLFQVYFIFHVLQLIFLGYRSCCLVGTYHQSLIINLHCQYLICAYVNSFLEYISSIISSFLWILVKYFFQNCLLCKRDTVTQLTAPCIVGLQLLKCLQVNLNVISVGFGDGSKRLCFFHQHFSHIF